MNFSALNGFMEKINRIGLKTLAQLFVLMLSFRGFFVLFHWWNLIIPLGLKSSFTIK